MDLFVDLLVPRTDAGVGVQVVVAVPLLMVFVWRSWPSKDLRLVAIGLLVFTCALFAARTLH